VVFSLHDRSVKFSFKTGSTIVDEAARTIVGVVAPDASGT
jgi:hypothetical protein